MISGSDWKAERETVMANYAPSSYRNTFKIPCFITKGNLTYGTICLSLASMDLSRRIGMRMDMWGHLLLNSTLKQQEILWYIWRMMPYRKILQNTVNTKKLINCPILSYRNIFRQPTHLETITSTSRLSQKWDILQPKQSKLLTSI